MSPVNPQEIILAEPRGFCAGVDRAIDIVDHALAKFGAPIYVRHEIVHNTHVVDDLRERGAIFIEDLNDVPEGATLVFSAHGVPKEVEHEAARRGFRVFDATCPLVTKVHLEALRFAREDYRILLIGHIDTVFERGTAAARPFRIEGERAYGPGVIDEKGGVVEADRVRADIAQTSARFRRSEACGRPCGIAT